eukprot:g722.t1
MVLPLAPVTAGAASASFPSKSLLSQHSRPSLPPGGALPAAGAGAMPLPAALEPSVEVRGDAMCGSLLHLAMRDGQAPAWGSRHVVLDPSLRIVACYADERAAAPEHVWELRRTRVARGGVQSVRVADGTELPVHRLLLTARTPRHNLSGEITVLASSSEEILNEWHGALRMVRCVCVQDGLAASEPAVGADAEPRPARPAAAGAGAGRPSAALELVRRTVTAAPAPPPSPSRAVSARASASAALAGDEGSEEAAAAAAAADSAKGSDFVTNLPMGRFADGHRVGPFLGRFGYTLDVDKRSPDRPRWTVITLRAHHATTVQALWRGALSRVFVWGARGLARRWAAATTIAAAGRGRFGRKRAAMARAERAGRLRQRAMLLIARVFKMYRMRKHAFSALEERRRVVRLRHEKACVIQRAARCRLARKVLAELRDEHEHTIGAFASNVIKKAFFRFLGIAKRPEMRRMVILERKLEPFGEGLPSNREQKDILLDMMRSVWGDAAEFPPDANAPFKPGFELPNAKNIHALCETLVYYLRADCEDSRVVFRVLGVRFAELIEALTAKRQQGFHFPPRLHNWLVQACAQAACNLGLAHQARGDLRRAEAAFHRSLALRTELYQHVRGTGHPQTSLDILNLVKILQAQGRYAPAKEFAARAQAIFDEQQQLAARAHDHRCNTHKRKVLGSWRGVWSIRRACRREAERRHRQKQLELCEKTFGAWLNLAMDGLHARGSWVGAKQHWRDFWQRRTLRKLRLYSLRGQRHRSWKLTANHCYKLKLARKAVRSWQLALPSIIHENNQWALATKWAPHRVRFVFYRRWCAFIEGVRKYRQALTYWEDHAKQTLLRAWIKYHRQFKAQRVVAALFRGVAHRKWMRAFEVGSMADFSREGWVHSRSCHISGIRCMVRARQWRTDFVFSVQCVSERTVHQICVRFRTIIGLLRTHPAFRAQRLTRGWLLDRIISMFVLLPSRRLIMVNEWAIIQNKISRRWATRNVARKFVTELFRERLPILARKRATLLLADGLTNGLCNKQLVLQFKRPALSGEELAAIYSHEFASGLVRSFSSPYLGVCRLSTGVFSAEYHGDIDGRYVFEELGKFASGREAANAYDVAALKHEDQPIVNFMARTAPEGLQRKVVRIFDQTFIASRARVRRLPEKGRLPAVLRRQREKEKERLEKLGIQLPLQVNSHVQIFIQGQFRIAKVTVAGWLDRTKLSLAEKQAEADAAAALKREFDKRVQAAQFLQGLAQEKKKQAALQKQKDAEKEREERERFLAQSKADQDMQLWIRAKTKEFERLERREAAIQKRLMTKEAIQAAQEKARREAAQARAKQVAENAEVKQEELEQKLALARLQDKERLLVRAALDESRKDKSLYQLRLQPIEVEILTAVETTSERAWRLRRPPEPRRVVHREALRLGTEYFVLTAWKRSSYVDVSEARSSVEADRLVALRSNCTFELSLLHSATREVRNCVIYEDELAECIDAQEVSFAKYYALFSRIATAFRLRLTSMSMRQHVRLGAVLAQLARADYGSLLARLPMLAARRRVAASASAHRGAIQATLQVASSFVNGVMRCATTCQTAKRSATQITQKFSRDQLYSAVCVLRGFAMGMHEAGFREKQTEGHGDYPLVLTTAVAGERAGPKRVFARELLLRVAHHGVRKSLPTETMRSVSVTSVRGMLAVLGARYERAFVLDTLAEAMFNSRWRAMDEIGVCVGMEGKAYMSGEDSDARKALFTVWEFCAARTVEEYAVAVDSFGIPELQEHDLSSPALWAGLDNAHDVEQHPSDLVRFAHLIFYARRFARFRGSGRAMEGVESLAHSLRLEWLVADGSVPHLLVRAALGFADAVDELVNPFVPISWQADPARMRQVAIICMLSVVATGMLRSVALSDALAGPAGLALCEALGLPAAEVGLVLAVLHPKPSKVVKALRAIIHRAATLATRHAEHIPQAQLSELEATFALLCRNTPAPIYTAKNKPSAAELARQHEMEEAGEAARSAASHSSLESLFRIQRKALRVTPVLGDELCLSCNVVAHHGRTESILLPAPERSRAPCGTGMMMDPNCIVSNNLRIGSAECVFAILHFPLCFEVRVYNRSTRCGYTSFFHEDEIAALLEMRETGLEQLWMLHDRLVNSLAFDITGMSEADRPKLGAMLAAMAQLVERKRARQLSGCLRGMRLAATRVANRLQQPWAADHAHIFVAKCLRQFVPSAWSLTPTTRVPNIHTLRIETIEDTPSKKVLPAEYFDVDTVELVTSRLTARRDAITATVKQLSARSDDIRNMLLEQIEWSEATIADTDAAIKTQYAELDLCHTMEDILFERVGEARWKPKYITPAAIRARWNAAEREPCSLGKMTRDDPEMSWLESPVVEFRIIAAGRLVRTNEGLSQLHLQARHRLQRRLAALDTRRKVVSIVLKTLALRTNAMVAILRDSLPLLRALEDRRWKFEKMRIGAAAMRHPEDERLMCERVRDVMREYIPALGHHRLLEEFVDVLLARTQRALEAETAHLDRALEVLARRHRQDRRSHKYFMELRRLQIRKTYNKVSALTKDWEVCREDEFAEEKRVGEATRDRDRREREIRELEFAETEAERRRDEAESLLRVHEQKKEAQEKQRFLVRQWRKCKELVKKANADMVDCGRQLGKHHDKLEGVDFKAQLMQARMALKKASNHAEREEGALLAAGVKQALAHLEEVNAVLEPKLRSEAVYSLFARLRDQTDQLRVLMTVDGMIGEDELLDDDTDAEEDEDVEDDGLPRTIHGTYVQQPRPPPRRPLRKAAKIVAKGLGDASDAVLNYFGPFDRPRLMNLYHWPSERFWLPLATPAKKKAWRERDAAMVLQAVARGRWLRGALAQQRWQQAEAQRSSACFAIQGMYRAWDARRVAVAIMRAQFTRTWEERTGTYCYKRQTTGEETYKKPFLLGSNDIELADVLQRKQHQLMRMGTEPPTPTGVALGTTVQVSVPGYLNIVGATVCKVNVGAGTLAVELAPRGPLSVVLLRDARVSDSDEPRVLRWLEPQGGVPADQARHGGTFSEVQAAVKIQSAWRFKIARVEMAKKLGQIYCKRLDVHTDCHYYENTRTREVTWEKPNVLAARTFGIGDIPVNAQGQDVHARVLQRFFRLLRACSTLYETDAIDSLLYHCVGDAPSLTVFLKPREVQSLAQMQVERTRKLLLERDQS